MCNQSQGYYGSNNTLSPQAQAVWDAYELVNCDEFAIDPRRAGLAAALEVAVEKLSYGYGDWGWVGKSAIIDADKLLAIAAELKSQ